MARPHADDVTGIDMPNDAAMRMTAPIPFLQMNLRRPAATYKAVAAISIAARLICVSV